MLNRAKLHCPQGHPYSGDNLVLKRNGHRQCRICKNAYATRYNKRLHPIPRKHGPAKIPNPTARRQVWNPTHPLADKRGYALESRIILHETIGPGPHPCHWCKTTVRWMPGAGLRTGALVADHVNGNIHLNTPENLVPACQPCNVERRRNRVGDAELFLTRKNGTRLRAVERLCEHCTATFLIAPSALTRPNKGRFCSMSCARTHSHTT